MMRSQIFLFLLYTALVRMGLWMQRKIYKKSIKKKIKRAAIMRSIYFKKKIGTVLSLINLWD